MENTKHEAYLVNTSHTPFSYDELAVLEGLGAIVEMTEEGTVVTPEAGYDDDIEAYFDELNRSVEYRFGYAFIGDPAKDYPNALADSESSYGRLIFVDGADVDPDEADGAPAPSASYEQHVEKTAAAAQAYRQADEHRARSAGAPSIVRDAANEREQVAHAAYMAAVLDAEDFCDAVGIARSQFDRDVEFRIGY